VRGDVHDHEVDELVQLNKFLHERYNKTQSILDELIVAVKMLREAQMLTERSNIDILEQSRAKDLDVLIADIEEGKL
jgi:hypothetical protein